MSQTIVIADLLGPILDLGNSIASTVEGAAGAIISQRSANTPASREAANVAIGQAAAAAISTFTGAGSVITDSGYLTDLNTVVGAGTTASTAITTLPTQLSDLSKAQSTYDSAVASGDTGQISSAGLSVANAVAAVVSSVGSIVSGVASGLVSAGVVSSAAAASIASVGLAISAAAGLLVLTTANAVVDAVRDAATSVSNLINYVESQLGFGDSGQSGAGQNGPGQNGTTGSGNGGPETGAGSTSMGKYQDGNDTVSPLVLDLTGSGIRLTQLNINSPYFDLTNDGFARQTGWIGEGTGLLCFDPDDRNITNITQLFGNATTDGFDILRKLDANNDHQIDASDPAFASLRVWIDANGNGTTDAGELYTLAQLGITSINLNSVASDQVIAGNPISSISSYTLADGTTREIADAWFANSTVNTRAVTPVDISAGAAALPQIHGAGTLRDLRSAMTLDQNLLALVGAFVGPQQDTSAAAVESAVQAILYEWAGVAQVDPQSRGGLIDARQLGFVEKYLGRAFASASDASSPEFRAAVMLQGAWNDLYDAAFARLVVQSPCAASVAPEFSYDAASDTIQAKASLAPAMLAAFQRLGTITGANLGSWDMLLRVADAARLDMGMSAALFEEFVSAATNSTVASVANAVISGIQISFDGSGRIQQTGTAINDTFYAGAGISRLVGGGGGNNAALRMPGNDVFIYSAGDGVLEILERDPTAVVPTNTLRFAWNISPSMITAKALSNGDLVVMDGVAGDQITLTGELRDDGSGVQVVQFADGTTWTRQQLMQAAAQSGTLGNDSLYGTSGAEVFDGKGGNDYIQGGGGGDTFIFNAGYGKLEINEQDRGSNPYNVLQLGPGITPASIIVRGRQGGSLVVTDGLSGDQITLDSAALFSYWGVQAVRFSDGTVWSHQQLMQAATTGTPGADTLYGTINAETFDGKGGNDYIEGGGGGDTFIFNAGYGKLEILESDASSNPHNVLQLGTGINAASIVVSGTANSAIVITDGIAGDQIKLDSFLASSGSGVQEVHFADGTMWTRQTLLQLATTGTTADDKLYGTIGADVFDGKGGNDYVQGGGGGDTFIFNAGYGKLEISESDGSNNPHNILQLGAGISASSLVVRGTSGGSVLLTDGIAGDQITLDSALSNSAWGVQTVKFADGTTWTREQLLQTATMGTSGNDTLYGTKGSDTFDGKGGNDIEYGMGGFDTYMVKPGYGPLTIVNGTASSNVAAGELQIQGVSAEQIWLQRVGNNLQVDVMGTKTVTTIQNWFSNGFSQLSDIAISGGASGNMMLDSQVNQLIQTMATFSASHTGFDPTSTANPMITDTAMLAAVNSCWHH